MRTLHLGTLAPLLAACTALACSGTVERGDVDDPSGGSSASGAVGGTGTSGGNSGQGGTGNGGTAGSGTGGTVGTGGSAGVPASNGVTLTTRLARLTHAQYRNTIRDLFGITDDASAELAPDALNGFAYDTSVDLRVDARLGPQYRVQAETLAARVASDDALFSRVVGCTTTDSACADSFISSFGQRAFRRPLLSAEATRFRTLFDQGAMLVASGNDFRDGVRLVVEAVLQSPQFLYRTEVSNQVGSDGLIALDSWEVASRLSYILWDTMPDQPLFDLAGTNGLATAEAVRTQAARLLDDDRAIPKAVSFHAQTFAFDRYSRITPDEETYPLAPDDMATRVRDATERFIEEIFTTNGGIAELLTAPYAFADEELAPLYGEDVSGGLQRLDFTDGSRKGLLMQLGFLASNAYSVKTDPIHRGLFVLRNVLCRVIPDPPPGASMQEPPETDMPPRNTREEITLLTSPPDCVGCHSEINPPGFAFEAFDAVGMVRTEENDVPVDTTGEIPIDGRVATFQNAGELVELLAQSPEAMSCYAGNWIQFAFGRRLSTEDAASQRALSMAPVPARQILADIAASPAFVKRLPNEVAP
jgi:hypothetical protein